MSVKLELLKYKSLRAGDIVTLQRVSDSHLCHTSEGKGFSYFGRSVRGRTAWVMAAAVAGSFIV